jgi:hypothetical protein
VSIRIANVVFDAPGETLDAYGRSAGAIASLYASLLGLRVVSRADHHRASGWPGAPDAGDEVDPLVFAVERSQPNLAFEMETSTYRAPSWPDPDHPQQVHLDVEVADVGDALARVVEHGGRQLAEFDEHVVCEDAVGHPLCLVAGGGARGRIARIVFDGPDPHQLAHFWRGLLDLRTTIADAPDRVEVGPADDRGAAPTLAFQRSVAAPPRWPDPAHPQQLHVDLDLGDTSPVVARERALSLGASPLPYLGGGHALADPAGHPFCIAD